MDCICRANTIGTLMGESSRQKRKDTNENRRGTGREYKILNHTELQQKEQTCKCIILFISKSILFCRAKNLSSEKTSYVL